jgi:hypothetical protein
MTEDERHQLEMWWSQLTSEQRDECRSWNASKPPRSGHPLWSHPLLHVSQGMVPRPAGLYLGARVEET